MQYQMGFFDHLISVVIIKVTDDEKEAFMGKEKSIQLYEPRTQ